jgi:hypothetical protein
MIEPPSLPLNIVDATSLPSAVRDVLRPAEEVRDAAGEVRRRPRFFYEIPSWEVARGTQLTSHFGLWELIDVDVREAAPLRRFPRYVPCAITALAAHLQLFRSEVGRVVRVAANGGYRSPDHALAGAASSHCWGAAANIYRIGDDWLDGAEVIERFREMARRVLPGVWTRPYGDEAGFAFDHLHLDLGYLVTEPHAAPTGGADGAEEPE